MWVVPISILGFVLFIGLAVFLIIYNNKKERERTHALQAMAAQLGWSFAAEAPMNTIAGLEHHALFSEGHSKEIKNFMYGEASGVKAAAFDYKYITGSGKHQSVHWQTVVFLEPDKLNAPQFALRPESLVHKMMEAFGYKDIDFGQRPEFSRQFILRGQNELAIRQAFNDRVLSFFESYPGTCIDAGGNQLFLYRAGHRYQPHEIEGCVGLALQVMNLLKRY
jgi:hypothetical protein